MADDLVLSRDVSAVRVLTLNRPERLNAWTYELGDRYFDLLDEAEADPGVGAVVLTGTGRGFCPGMDVAELAATAAGRPRKMPAHGRRMTHAAGFRKPLVAAVNGPCVGFGLIQALHADVRFASPTAVFGTGFVRRGLNAEYGSSWLLPKIIGHARASELLISGRTMDAAEAQRVGLVHEIAEDVVDAAIRWASEVSTHCSPTAIADIKLAMREDWLLSLHGAEDHAKELGHAPGHRVDLAEGVASFRERRPPRFTPLATRED